MPGENIKAVSEHADGQDRPAKPAKPTLGECAWVFARMGVLSFGGPAAQIGIQHRILVDEKKWLSEKRFEHALNFCMLLPGPEATQLATYVGWLLHGVRGGLLAAALFVLPGAIVMLCLSFAYVRFGDLAPAEGVLLGLKSATIVIVLDALRRLLKRSVNTAPMAFIALGVFIASGVFKVGFPWLIIAGALLGLFLGPAFVAPHAKKNASTPLAPALLDDDAGAAPVPDWRRSFLIAFAGVVLWLGPLVALHVRYGESSVFTGIGVSFAKASLVTFGGAYAVLGFIRDQFVDVHQWLGNKDMIAGLSLAETTPGPLILVGQFVSYVAASRASTPITSVLAGVFASVIFLWSSFVPCLLWIFVFGPYVEMARHSRRLRGMLSGISAAVVGTIATLALWLVVHTAFASVTNATTTGMSIDVPVWSSVRWSVVVIATLAAISLLRLKWSVGIVLLGSLCVGVVWKLGPMVLKAP